MQRIEVVMYFFYISRTCNAFLNTSVRFGIVDNIFHHYMVHVRPEV